MTDNEIIKALECCGEMHECSVCPRHDRSNDFCMEDLHADALYLINRQKAEIDDLKRDTIPKLQWGLSRANKMGMDLEKENEQLKAEIEDLKLARRSALKVFQLHTEIRAEANKEFAERLKERKYLSSEWSHGEHPYVVEEDDIDDLLEELTEEMK